MYYYSYIYSFVPFVFKYNLLYNTKQYKFYMLLYTR